MKSLLTSILFVLAFCSLAQDEAYDSLWVQNNILVHGEFLSLSNGIIKFDGDIIDEIDLKHYEVITFKATTKYYRIQTLSGEEYYGWILPGDTGYVHIYNLLDSVPMAMSRLVYVSSFEEDFSDRWTGSFGAGYSYTRSSDIGRFNLDVLMSYKTQWLLFSLTSSAIFTSEDEGFLREREDVGLQVNRDLSESWGLFLIGHYQQNLTLGLQYRLQGGGGVEWGYYLSNQSSLNLGGGLVVNTEKDYEGERLNSIEAPIIITFKVFKYRDPDISLTVDQGIYVGVTEIGRIRHDGELRLRWEIIDDLNLDIQLYDNFDSQPLSGSAQDFDYGIVSGISYSL